MSIIENMIFRANECLLSTNLVIKMNLKMIRPRNETENLLHSITKNCETLTKQTHTKRHETLVFKLRQPR